MIAQNNFSIMVATHRPRYGDEAMQLLSRFNPIRVEGSGFPSCSYLWNKCIELCPSDLVIICNERARPRSIHIRKMIWLLKRGFALVGLYRFGFFGFYKDLVKTVGRFDERYVGGWYEDNDTMLRLREANLAYYESEEVPYLQSPSSWKHEEASDHFLAKWGSFRGPWTRLLPEDPQPTGGSTRLYKPWSDSVLLRHSGLQYRLR